MNAIVFGGTGFIGGHVVEQLQALGHHVTVAARDTSDITFLGGLGVDVIRIDFEDVNAIRSAIDGNAVVYNCTADTNLSADVNMEAEVEIKLTRTLVEAAALAGASRFIQLSTILVYDFRSNAPMDEMYQTDPEYPIQRLALKREALVSELGKMHGLHTIILRPASTIGVRDRKSFFARLFFAHSRNQYPLIGDGSAQISLVDTRDIGRAMEWLGTFKQPADENGIYTLKGFDTTWAELKYAMDEAVGRVANILEIPRELSEVQLAEYGLNPFTLKTFTINRLWDDSKVRRLGFQTKYSLREAVETEVNDLLSR